LWPREHGAYAQLAAPLVTACVMQPPVPAALLLAAAAWCAFLANEPLLVVLGHRGPRMKQTDGRRAAIRLAGLALGAVAAGAVGLALVPHAIAVAGVVALGAVAMLALAIRRAEHSLAGELVAAIALPGAGVPVAVASGMAWQRAAIVWAAWSLGYAASVIAVHRVIARHKRPASRIDALASIGLVCVTLATCAVALWIPIAALAIPLVAISAMFAIRPPPATRLRAIGVALVIASIAANVISALHG
jgi:hypothetical protein